MITIVHYYVKRKFHYKGKDLSQGQEWFPEGARNDEAIIRTGLVRTVREAVTEKPPRKERVKNAKDD